MSRRSGRGGRPRHLDHRTGPRSHDPTRPARPTAPSPVVPPPVVPPPAATLPEPIAQAAEAAASRPADEPPAEVARDVHAAVVSGPAHEPSPGALVDSPERADLPGPDATNATAPAATLAPDGNGSGRPLTNGTGQPQGERPGGCTTAQLRRFIKSRAYVPIHEIRRRFLITTEDDDVAWIDLESGRVFVGLPPREGQMLGELLRAGEVGYELQLDPVAPVVVGVYPMRPVSRG